jgi:hypothetical protein
MACSSFQNAPELSPCAVWRRKDAVSMAGLERATACAITVGDGYRDVPSSKRLGKIWPYNTKGSVLGDVWASDGFMAMLNPQ